MPTIRLAVICFLLVVLIIMKLSPSFSRKVTLLVLGERGCEDLGRRALADQPDRITLVPSVDGPGAKAFELVVKLSAEGFTRAGSFTIPEMGGLPLHFSVKPAEAMCAVVYEHRKAGVWMDLFTRYEDGASFTLATTKTGGALDDRPGHPVLRAAGMEPAAAVALFLSSRTPGQMKQVTADQIAGIFADAYADAIAWRKGRSISAEEVQRIGVEKYA